jgi:DNA invertase Pin-like site-specific DNA recombinase
MKTAAIYTRTSTPDQHVSQQLYDLRELAAQRGFEVVKEYQDSGVSGRRSRRPGLDALMLDARQHKFSVVLVAAFDRVARSTRHFLHLVDELDSLGIAFVSRREGISTDDRNPIGRFFLTVISSIAEIEAALVRDRILASHRRCRLEGIRIGRPPMNIDRTGVVRDRLSGMTLTAVATKWGISRSLVCKLVKRANAGDKAPVPPPPQVVDFVKSASA